MTGTVVSTMMKIPLVFALTSVAALAQVSGAAKPQVSPTPQGTQASAPAKPAIVPQQAANPAALGAQTGAQNVAPNAPVITIHGLCPSGATAARGSGPKAAKSSACAKILTRAQFEQMINAINVNGQTFPPGALRNIAESYAQFLALADAAQKSGVDKDPKVQELLRIARLRALAEAYRHSLEEKYRNPSAEEITAYYNKNVAKFEQVKISRALVPKFNPKIPQEGKPEFEKKAQQVATDIRERAAKGEDLDKLQKEAYTTLDLANPPSIDMGLKKRGTLPPAIEQEIFALQPSEITKLETDPGGFAFYKLQSKETIALDQARAEITRTIFQQHLEAAMKAVVDSTHTDLNDQYFGARPAPAPTTIPGIQQPAQGARPVSPATPAAVPSSTPGKPASQTPNPPK
jgi:hypothetical protein